MNVTEIVQSSGWKNFMAKLYGIGAAVVIVGALFKIMHWPGASMMLIAGLSTEAVIFFFSAFEPLHEELDWTLVYPELAGMTDPQEIEGFKEHREINPGHQGVQESLGASPGGYRNSAGAGGSGGNNDALAGLMTIPEVDSDTFSKLGEGLTKLSTSVDNLNDISEATIATKEYFENVKNASDSAKSLSETYQQSNESLKESSNNLSMSYENSVNQIKQSGQNFIQSYEKLSSSLLNGQEGISRTSSEYENNLSALNKNLSALNTVYELQLQDTSQHLKDTKQLYNGLDEMTKSLKESVDETVRYKNEISKLGNSLSSLNEVYGNMLSSVSAATNK